MAYATLAELKTRVGDDVYAQLSDLSGGGIADDVVGQARLDDAHGLVNMKLAGRYKTPVDTSDTTVANALRAMTCAVAYSLLLENNVASTARVSEGKAAEMKRWLDLLEEIYKGKGALPGEAALAGPVSSGSPAIVVGSPRVFGGDSLSGLN